MGLSRALVDQARRVYVVEDPSQPNAEGQAPAGETADPWIPARYRPQQENEQRPPERGGYSYVDSVAALMLGATYVDGSPLVDPQTHEFVAFDADDMVQVASRELGTLMFYVNGAARPIRKRRAVIGWRVELRASREPTVQEGELPLAPDQLDSMSDFDWSTEVG